MTRPRPKKNLGQHFLTDRNILATIADAADVRPDDTVVEIGPGRGSLTRLLAERATRVVAVELDELLFEELRAEALLNVEVVLADARRVNAAALLGGDMRYKLLGNLPYYAALPILRGFLEGDCRPTKVAILLQLEVARSICAAPGHMSLASLGVQLYGTPRIVRRVAAGAFNPPPKVTSAVVAIDVFEAPAEGVQDISHFFRIARAGFSAPRKQLRNALANGLGTQSAEAELLLEAAGIDPQRRAESLSVAEWAALANAAAAER